jgi:ribosomal protein S3AE
VVLLSSVVVLKQFFEKLFINECFDIFPIKNVRIRDVDLFSFVSEKIKDILQNNWGLEHSVLFEIEKLLLKLLI